MPQKFAVPLAYCKTVLGSKGNFLGRFVGCMALWFYPVLTELNKFQRYSMKHIFNPQVELVALFGFMTWMVYQFCIGFRLAG